MSTMNANTASDDAIARMFKELHLATLADNVPQAIQASTDGVLDKYVTLQTGDRTVFAVLADLDVVDSTFTSPEAGSRYKTTYSGPAFTYGRKMHQTTFTALHHIAPDRTGRLRTYAAGVVDAEVRDLGRTIRETEDVLEELAFAGLNGRMDVVPCVVEDGLVARMGVPEAEANSYALVADRNDGDPARIDIFPNRETANAYLHPLDAQSRDGGGGGYVVPRLEHEFHNGLPKRDSSYYPTRRERLRQTDSPDELRRIFREAEKGAKAITPFWEQAFTFRPGRYSSEERAKIRRIQGDYFEIAAQASHRLKEMENAAERELARQRIHTEHFEQAIAYFADERLWQPNQFTEIGDFYQFQEDDRPLFAPYKTREIVEDNTPANPAPGDQFTITRNNLAFDLERNKYCVTTKEHYIVARSYLGETYPHFFRAESAGIVPLNEKVLTRGQLERLRREALPDQENTMSAQAETTEQTQGKRKYFTDEVAGRFAASLDKGESPLQRRGVPVLPYNPATGRAYHGINALSLMLQNRADDRWLTWDEAKMAGLRIKNDEKPTPVQKWPPKREGEEKQRAITAWLYNGEQLLGMPPMPHKPERPDPMDRVLDFLKHSGASIVNDREHRGYYAKKDDVIHLANPDKVGKEAFCEDALHQYFKSTGHPSRLDRADTFNAPGRGKEAQEELICAFATMSMCAELGIPIQPARYIDLAQTWRSQMVARPLDFARDIRTADETVKITLDREHARKTELNRNESELWRAAPEEFPHGAVKTFLDRKEVLDAIENIPDALDKFMLDDKEIFAVKETGYTLAKKDLNPDNPETEFNLLIKTQGFDRDGNAHDVLLSYDIKLNGEGTIEHRGEPTAHSIRENNRSMNLPRDWSGHLELQGYRTNDNGEPEKTDAPEFYTVLAKRENGEPEPVASFTLQQDANKYKYQVTRQFEYQGKRRGIDFDYEQLKSPDRGFTSERKDSDRPLGERGAEAGQTRGEAKDRTIPAMEPTEETRAEAVVAMEAVGMIVSGNHPILDNKGHRIDVEGDKPRQGSGWYIGFTNGKPGGVCVNNRSNERVEWSKSRGYKFTENKKRELNCIAQAKKTSYQKAEEATREAALVKLHSMIENVFTKPDEPTPYLAARNLPLDSDIYQNKGSACIPLYDLKGTIHSMAYIQANGTKRFAKDLGHEGYLHVCGGVEKLKTAKAFVLGEGYSTVKTADVALDRPDVAHVVCFGAGNMANIAKQLRERFPDVPQVVLGENDKHLELRDPPLKNTGLEAAKEAVEAGKGVSVFPIWPEGAPVDKHHTDFDDVRRIHTPKGSDGREGFEAVRGQLRPVVERAIELAQENQQNHQHEKTRGSLARA